MSGLAGHEILHEDGSLTRISEGADADVDGAIVRLRLGAVWHEPPVTAPGSPLSVEVGGASIRCDDAIVAIVAEPDGTCFVTSVTGRVVITANGGSVDIATLQAVQLAHDGSVLDTIDATEEELDLDAWIGRNIRATSAGRARAEQPDAAIEQAEEPEPENQPEPFAPPPPEPFAPEPEPFAPEPFAPEPEPVVPGPPPDAAAESQFEPVAGVPPAAEAVEATDGVEATEAVPSSPPPPPARKGRKRRRRVLGAVFVAGGLVALVVAIISRSGGGSSPENPDQIAQRVKVQPTRCASSGDQLVVEGTITNTDNSTHSYRVQVVFTGPASPPHASADVHRIGSNKSASWKASTSYTGPLAAISGCQVAAVQPISG